MDCDCLFEHDAETSVPEVIHPVDPVLTGAVRDALIRDPLVQAGRIRVSAAAGWVKLEGDVDYEAQSCDAEIAARSVPGVLGVINEIKVEVPASQKVRSGSSF